MVFPYISGYLSFRELPALLVLMESLPSHFPAAEIVFVDGNGVLHHRGAGIATHFGVLADLRTIGVGKKLLCGQVDLDGLPEEWSVLVFGEFLQRSGQSSLKRIPLLRKPVARLRVIPVRQMRRQNQLRFDDAEYQRDNDNPSHHAEKSSHTSGEQDQWQKRGHGCQHTEDDGNRNLPGTIDGRLYRWLSHLLVAVDAFAHDDGIVY